MVVYILLEIAKALALFLVMYWSILRVQDICTGVGRIADSLEDLCDLLEGESGIGPVEGQTTVEYTAPEPLLMTGGGTDV